MIGSRTRHVDTFARAQQLGGIPISDITSSKSYGLLDLMNPRVPLLPKPFRRPSLGSGVQCSEIENDTQCRSYSAHLVEAEDPDTLTEPARVDRRGLLGKYPGVHAADFNLGPKAGGTSRD